jgi:hypothetical protein
MDDRLIDQACDLYCHGIARIDTLYAATVMATPAPPPSRSLGAAPPLILGRLPAAVLTPRRNDFRDLVARLPIGGE